MTKDITLAELAQYEGVELQATDWLLIDQSRIDMFAACTDDYQFIHTDAGRAQKETAYGGTIAHGMLTLSLILPHMPEDFPNITDLAYGLNYGFNRVRFLQVVPANSEVRILTRVLSVTDKGPAAKLIIQEKTMEIRGMDKPAFVAEQINLYVSRQGDE